MQVNPAFAFRRGRIRIPLVCSAPAAPDLGAGDVDHLMQENEMEARLGLVVPVVIGFLASACSSGGSVVQVKDLVADHGM